MGQQALHKDLRGDGRENLASPRSVEIYGWSARHGGWHPGGEGGGSDQSQPIDQTRHGITLWRARTLAGLAEMQASTAHRRTTTKSQHRLILFWKTLDVVVL